VSLRGVGSILVILGVALLAAVASCFLPDSPYERWQLLDGTIHSRARWIYERIHFDPTPIDVAFVGPSRTGHGVDAPRLGAALAAEGLPHNVVNFSLPETGRNINYAIVEEMLTEKRPKLLVLGVIEKPSRFGHPAFKYIARPGLIENPGYFGNISYFGDIIYLPFRQIRLFAADVLPALGGQTKNFDPERYAGSSIDTTGNIILPGGRIKNGVEPATPAELQSGVHKLRAGTHLPILPRYPDIEFGDERYYVRKICDLARRKGVPVAFLFIPYYSGPSTIQELPLYQHYGPVWNAGYLASHAEWYADYAHLTHNGADHLTDWLVAPVSAMLRK
jgi:hypothetical protein